MMHIEMSLYEIQKALANHINKELGIDHKYLNGGFAIRGKVPQKNKDGSDSKTKAPKEVRAFCQDGWSWNGKWNVDFYIETEEEINECRDEEQEGS